VKPVELILERAEGVRRVGSGWMVSCPLPGHGRGFGDRKPSVSVTEGDDSRALVNCQAGCQTEDVVAEWGLSMNDLFENRNDHRGGGSYASQKTTSTDQPASLENYAAYVGLPVAFLKSLGLKEYRHLGEPAVSMPYLDENGEVVLTRSRVSLTGKPKVKTRKGDKHRLYGLWKLEDARTAGYAWMVEGESDWQTLCYHNEPAVGIPGANGWKAEWAADLEGIDRLYFVVEDEAGEQCWRKLTETPEIRDKLYRVELDGVKDVSKLHQQDPEGFTRRLRTAREDAKAWLDITEMEEQERVREAWAECRELAQSPDILEEFSCDLEACRVVGERTNGELLYLALTSRLLDKIVSVAVKGPSSGGKSFLVTSVVGFFPERAVYQFTSFSEKTLYYTEESLSHRHLILTEAAGGGEVQEYTIRTLLSEGRLEYEFVEKTSEGLRARRICKEGPTGFITTTTRDKLHAENETRYLSLVVKDTREQTRRVFRALAEENSEEPDRRRWHAFQTWLEAREHRVTIPYAGLLAEKMGDVAVRLRRDFSVILSLIKAHTILHQATRERDAQGRIIATLADYARVRGLVSGLISEGVEATVPKAIRETVEAVQNIIDGGDEDHATNKAVAEELKIDKGAASRRVRTAIGRGYLKNLEDRKGHPARLVLAESMPEDQEILPAPEELEGVDPLTVDRGGIQHPPPPSETGIGGGGSNISPETASTGQRSREREEIIL
jgi:transposase-like protein